MTPQTEKSARKKAAPLNLGIEWSAEWRTRDQLPTLLNKLGLTGVGVEVGVERAHHATQLRRNWDGKLLVLVDKWEVNQNYAACTRERHLQSHDEAMQHIKNATKPIEVIKMWSTDAAQHIKGLDDVNQIKRLWNGGLDFVYLDADHSYTAVKNDLESWLPLIRPGGIICGHDFVSDGFHIPGDPITAYETAEASGAADACPFGVQRAVLERFSADVVKLTSPETDLGWRSWLVQVPELAHHQV